jgi:carboxyl-terminal processing protease
MNPRTRILVLLVSAPVIAFAVVGGFLGKAIAREEPYAQLRVFDDVVRLVVRNYVEPVDSGRIMGGAMRGLAESLDPDSAYLPPGQVRTYQQGDKGPAGDVGITLTRNYYLRALAVQDGSPAEKAGLRAGDFIRLIDNKPTREMSVFEGTHLLRGAPGTKVTLTIIRSTVTDPHVVEITRAALPPATVSGSMRGQTVGYVRIPGFTPRTAEELRAKVAELRRQGAARLVVDVRNCAAGTFEDGLAAARLFVPSGTLAIREIRDKPREPITAAAGDGAIALPVVVVVNIGTAGPAELFAAALGGNKRADLVGEKTMGRVTTQKFVPLPDGSAMLLSNGWFLGPSGEQLSDKGLTPNIEVDEPDVEFGTPPPATDPLLLKAIERIGSKSAG